MSSMADAEEDIINAHDSPLLVEADSEDSLWQDDNRSRRKTVTWEGRQFTEKEGILLKRLFNGLQDYFGQPTCEPKVTCNVQYFFQTVPLLSKSGGKWNGELKFMYKMEHNDREVSQQLDYIGIDVCIDLTPKKELMFGGHEMEGYGNTWVYVYAPIDTIEAVISKFEKGTGFKASKSWLVEDENSNMVTFEAKLLTDPHPECSFWIPKEKDENYDCDNQDSGREVTRVGSIQEACQDPLHQVIVKCTGVFTVRAEFLEDEDARLTFTLVSTRSQGVVNNLAPVVYDPRRCTSYSENGNLVCMIGRHKAESHSGLL